MTTITWKQDLKASIMFSVSKKASSNGKKRKAAHFYVAVINLFFFWKSVIFLSSEFFSFPKVEKVIRLHLPQRVSKFAFDMRVLMHLELTFVRGGR